MNGPSPIPEPPEVAPAVAPDKVRRRKAPPAMLPSARFFGPMPWVIAILIALVVIASAGGLALRNLANSAEADLSAAVTVQIIEPNADLRAARGQAAVKVLTSIEGVQTVRLLPEAELVALLEPWLGAAIASGDVPIPVLIDVELTGRASPRDVDRIEEALAKTVPGVRVDAQSDWLRPVYDALAALQWLALGLIALVVLATVAAVGLAARSAFAAARDTVEIIHLLGATDRQITAVFLRTVLRESAFGALVGTAIGAGAIGLLGRQFAALDSGMTSGGGLVLVDWLAIAAIPLAGVLLALVTARITIALALKDML